MSKVESQFEQSETSTRRASALACGPFSLRRAQSGFTMVELLVVLAIIVVVSTISVPTIASMTSPKNALRKEGRGIVALMNQARAAAVARKVQVDLRIDPEAREIRMIEARVFRSLQLDDPHALSSGAQTDRYEKVLAFDEDYELARFTADQIVTDEDDDNAFSEVAEDADAEEGADLLAVSFSHFGGSCGGGISLIRGDIRLDIAADVLTGRPKVVKTLEEE